MNISETMRVSGFATREADRSIRVRAGEPEDAAAVALIYNHYVANTAATFETETVHPSVMADRMRRCREAGLHWLLAEQGGRLLGYAYAVPWKPRQAYGRSCETTIYLHPDCTGRGTGAALYRDLMERLARSGYHTAIGGIALPNPASVALHEKLGFEKVAHFRQVGFKQGRWIDVGYWQLIFDAE